MIRGLRNLAAGLGVGVLVVFGEGVPDPHEAILRSWLEASTHLNRFQAEFQQTRHLKALTQPLVSTGRVWFSAPDRFRWELGDPPQSVAVRSGDTLLILSPRLRRAESYSLGGNPTGPARDLMGLLDGAFPRSIEDWKGRFEITGVSTNQGMLRLDLRPRSPAARKLMPVLIVGLDPGSLYLRLTEMVMVDGSRIRSEFGTLRTNAPIPSELFSLEVDPAWKLTRNESPP